MSMGVGDKLVTGQIDHIRYFDQNTYSFIFINESYEIDPLYNEIKELLNRVNKELSKSMPV